MKTEYEEYRDTSMVGGYDPEKVVLRDGTSWVTATFRDTEYWIRDAGFHWYERNTGWRQDVSCHFGIPFRGHGHAH